MKKLITATMIIIISLSTILTSCVYPDIGYEAARDSAIVKSGAKLEKDDVVFLRDGDVETYLDEKAYVFEYIVNNYAYYNIILGAAHCDTLFDEIILINGYYKDDPVNFLGIDKAKLIALEAAGAAMAKPEDIIFIQKAMVNISTQDEPESYVYRVFFYYNSIRYDYDINVHDGSIISEVKTPAKFEQKPIS